MVDPRDPVWSGTVLIAPNHIESGTGRVLARETAAEQGADSGKYVVRAGDLIYSKIRPALNKVAVATEDCLCSADMYPVVPAKEADVRFCQYYMLADPFLTYAALAADRVKMPKVNREELSGAPWLVPSLAEQRRIADYLDRETATIDALIEKQRRLVGLLRQRRRATINRATQFGLSDEVNLVEARNEFLRKLPAVWREARFSREVEIRGGLVDPRDEPWANHVLLAPNHIERDTGRVTALETAAEQGADSGKYLVTRGDLVYSKIRPALNKVTVAGQACLCSADMYAMHLRHDGDARFFKYWMLSDPFHEFASQIADRVKMPKINREELKGAPWVVPPVDEQREIADHLDRETAKIDALIAKAERFIELAQERRAALITAAVTGQIEIPTED
ncbi:hypothetical protein ACWEBH_02895 [Micrococcus endophyticus]